MESTTLRKTEWQPKLDEVSRSGSRRFISIGVSGADIGAQTAAENVRLLGVSYDHHGDEIALDTDGHEYRIRRPKALVIAHDALGVSALEIIDKDDRRTIVSFDSPIKLAVPNE
jgi:hypothetical protein